MTSVHLKQTFRSRGARCSSLGTEASLRTRAQCTEIGGTPRQPARQRLARGGRCRRSVSPHAMLVPGQEPIVHVWILSPFPSRRAAVFSVTKSRLVLPSDRTCMDPQYMYVSSRNIDATVAQEEWTQRGEGSG